jgi:copper-binding protein NosD
MNIDHDLEREIVSVLTEAAPVRPPEHLLSSVISSARRKRRWPRWYALVKEPTMHSDSRLTVGSPTARIAAVMAATLLLALLVGGAGIAGSRLLAADGIIVVDQTGDGTVETIAEAVAMAKGGDTVRVMPGTYAEPVVVDKDIVLEGDPGSEREAIVVTFTLEHPTVTTLWDVGLPTAVRLEDATATLRHLHFTGPDHGIAINVSGGDVIIEDVSGDLESGYMGQGRYVVFVQDAATAAVRDVTCDCSITTTEGSTLTVERFTQPSEDVVLNINGSDAVVSDSLINRLWIQEGADATVTGSTIRNEVLVDPGAVTELRDNVIDGAENDQPYGVRTDGGTTTLRGNIIRGQFIGLDIGAGTSPITEGNRFEDNTTAINVIGGAAAAPEVLANITDNTFCGNGTNVSAPGEVDVDLAGNEVCDADLTTAP